MRWILIAFGPSGTVRIVRNRGLSIIPSFMMATVRMVRYMTRKVRSVLIYNGDEEEEEEE
jgi:hypothetical protein